MSGSEEEEDATSMAKNHLNLLIAQCSKLKDNVNKSERVDIPARTLADETGSLALKLLRKTIPQVEDFAAGRIQFDELEDSVQEFIYQFQIFSHMSGIYKTDRKNVLEIQLTMQELEKELQKPWNTERDEKVVEAAINQNSSSSSQLDSNANKTPQKSQTIESPLPCKKIRFKRVSPKSDLLQTYKCHLCPKIYSWLKALRRHLKDHHEGEGVPPNMKEVEDRVTCRMCQTKQSRDLLARHMRDVHKVDRADKGTVFRFFFYLWTRLHGNHCGFTRVKRILQ